MKTWNRWIGCCAVASTLSWSVATVQGQQGYNFSGGSPAPNGAAQPQQTQSPQGATPVSRNTLNLQANPALQPSVPASAPAEVVTKDPYAANPLSPQEIDYLDRLLVHWEQSTKGIKRLSCEFRCYEYNSNANFVQQMAQQSGKDIRQLPATISAGVIRYMVPDKGMYQITQKVALTGQLNKDNTPEMKASENIALDHWICDGTTVHNYNHKEKVVTHFTIPKEMQGLGILESPMPFLLGVEAKKMKERYWLRPLPSPLKPDGTQNQDIRCIQAYPKLQQDAVNYDHVEVYLDAKEFLPIALVKYGPEHNDAPGEAWVDSREHYEFTSRARDASLLTKISEGLFNQQFIPLKVDSSWREETHEYVPPGMENPNMEALMQPQAPPQGIPQGGGYQGAPNATPPGYAPGSAPNSANRPAENGLRTR